MEKLPVQNFSMYDPMLPVSKNEKKEEKSLKLDLAKLTNQGIELNEKQLLEAEKNLQQYKDIFHVSKLG